MNYTWNDMKQSIKIFCALLKTDLQGLRFALVDKAINTMVYCTSMLFINQYLLPQLGITTSYGTFIFASLISTVGFFEVFPAVIELITDFMNTQAILYRCTLPLPVHYIWLAKIFYYAVGAFCMGLCVIPLGALFLGGGTVMATIIVYKFFLLLIATSLFYGSFILFAASFVSNMNKIRNVWMRFLWPLWFLGCFNISWNVVHGWSPLMSYFLLFNPIVYTMEGMRAAMLGQEGSLNYWMCLGIIIMATTVCSYWGINRLNKKLDLVV